jgi:hypothetical protein
MWGREFNEKKKNAPWTRLYQEFISPAVQIFEGFGNVYVEH